MNSFKSILSIKSLIKSTVDQVWLSVDFSRVLDDWCTSDEFQTLIPWELDFKWCPKLYELLIIDHGAQIPQEWPPSTALTDSWPFLGFWTVCVWTDDLQVFNPLPKYFKKTSKPCELVGQTPRPWFNEKFLCLLGWLIRRLVWPNSWLLALEATEGQCKCYAMDHDMLWPNMKMYV